MLNILNHQPSEEGRLIVAGSHSVRWRGDLSFHKTESSIFSLKDPQGLRHLHDRGEGFYFCTSSFFKRRVVEYEKKTFLIVGRFHLLDLLLECFIYFIQIFEILKVQFCASYYVESYRGDLTNLGHPSFNDFLKSHVTIKLPIILHF